MLISSSSVDPKTVTGTAFGERVFGRFVISYLARQNSHRIIAFLNTFSLFLQKLTIIYIYRKTTLKEQNRISVF